MTLCVNKLFVAWFMTLSFFNLYAASHGEPGALVHGLESAFYAVFVMVVDHYDNLFD